jgi:hypothetical protein
MATTISLAQTKKIITVQEQYVNSDTVVIENLIDDGTT